MTIIISCTQLIKYSFTYFGMCFKSGLTQEKALLALECVTLVRTVSNVFLLVLENLSFTSIYTLAGNKLRLRHAPSSSWRVFLRRFGVYFSYTRFCTLFILLEYVI